MVPSRRRRVESVALVLSAMLICLAPWASAQVVTDGSLGPAVRLHGPDYLVDETLGRRVGDNLFHSFSLFGLARGETATFTGAPDIRHLVARVTGGEVSQIDGTLRSRVGQAGFYLINPAGVLFGPKASLDLPASFHVGAADSIGFGDGARLFADLDQASMLSVAPPEDFGFGPAAQYPGRISVDGASLGVAAGSQLFLAGRDIEVGNSHPPEISRAAALTAEAGVVQLLAQGALAGRVSWRPDSSLAAEGTLRVTDQSTLGTSREFLGQPVTGSLRLSAGTILVDDAAALYAGHSTVEGFSPGVSIDARHFVLDGATVRAEPLFVLGAVQSGSVGQPSPGIRLQAEDAQLRNGALLASSTGIAGRSAGVDVRASVFDVLSGSSVRTESIGDQPGGMLLVTADRLYLEGQGSHLSAEAKAGGRAGDIRIGVNEMLLQGAGVEVTSSTIASGDAGNIRILARDSWRVADGASIQSATSNRGQAGEISLTTAGQGVLANGSLISAISTGAGDAGKVELHAGSLWVGNEGDQRRLTGLVTQADRNSSGRAGSLEVRVLDRLQMQNGGVMLASNIGTGSDSGTSAAAILVSAGEMVVQDASTLGSVSLVDAASGGIEILVDQNLLVRGLSRISSESRTASAGAIDIAAASLLMHDAFISTSVGQIGRTPTDPPPPVDSVKGDGGDIDVTARTLIMDTGLIQANTRGIGGRGGAVGIEVGELVSGYGSLQVGFAEEITRVVPGSRQNFIQAASPEGVPGTITISDPDVENVNLVLGLDRGYQKERPLGEHACAVDDWSQISTLVLGGRGALPRSVTGEDAGVSGL